MKGIWRAAQKGDIKEVEKLLKKGGNPNEVDTARRTALHYAADVNQLAVANILVQSGAIVDSYDGKNDTPLDIAVHNSYEDFAVFLVEHGADVNSTFDKLAKMQTPLPKRFELKLKDSARKASSNKPQKQNFPVTSQHSVEESAYIHEPVYVDKSEPVFQEPAFTEPAFDEAFLNLDILSPPLSTSSQNTRFTNSSAPPRAVSSIVYQPAAPAVGERFGDAATSPKQVVPVTSSPFTSRTTISNATSDLVTPTKPFQTDHHSQDTRERAHSRIAAGTTSDKNVVDLATLITLMVELVLAGTSPSFTPIQLKELSDATSKLAQYLPLLTDSIRILSHNVKALPAAVIELKRLKRLKDDYTAVRERVRPLQDALRVLVLDRRANAIQLLTPPILLLVGGLYSMMITLEQATPSQMDIALASITRSVRDLTAGADLSPNARISGLQSLVKLFRCVSVWSMETRTPKVNVEVATKVYHMVNGMKVLLGPTRTNVVGSAKAVAESLKSTLAGIKTTVPARLGPEISMDEEKQVLDDALSMLQHAQNMFLQNTPSAFSFATKQIVKLQLEKIIVGLHSITNLLCNTQTKTPPAGRVLLTTVLGLTSSVGELGSAVTEDIGHAEYLLPVIELIMHYINIVELTAACRATQNRIAHQSHLHISLLGLVSAISIIVDTNYYNIINN